MYWSVGAVLAVALLACSAGTGDAACVIAHRGASADAPENTVAAAKLAWEQGADALELDVHLSLDGRPVVIHDSGTKRTTGVDLVVAQTHSWDLRRLDAGSFKGEQFAGERIPFLEEMLRTAPPGRPVFVEIKSGPETVPVIAAAMRRSGKLPQCVVISFSLDVCVEAKKALPDIPVLWLRGTVTDRETGKPLPHDPAWIQTVREKGIDGLDLHWAGITPEFAESCAKAGVPLYAWTVNDPEEARRLHRLGVQGITTDVPSRILEALGRKGKK